MRPQKQRIAVIGGGIAGMGAAYLLGRCHDVVLYEADRRLGGHSNTVDADADHGCIPVDTGFIVYNERNYPNLTQLFAELGVPTAASEMSFSVSVGAGHFEWAGSSLATVFAQPRNLARPGFHRMLRDVARFNRNAARDLLNGALGDLSLGAYLERHRYSMDFRLDYLLPMGAAIWSVPMQRMLSFPARSFVRFFVNHGLLGLGGRPQWRTVSGGSREYVRRLAQASAAEVRLASAVRTVIRGPEGVQVEDERGASERFDQVVLAVHGDQALGMLADSDGEEREILGSFTYQQNLAVLHRDPRLMPRRRAVWSSWNYISEPVRDLSRRVSLTYWMNRLQNFDPSQPLFVTMNPIQEPERSSVIGKFQYAHPVFDDVAIRAQGDLFRVQGRRRTWFCGAWCGYGFHEDGLKSAIAVAMALGAPPSWRTGATPADRPAAAAAGLATAAAE